MKMEPQLPRPQVGPEMRPSESSTHNSGEFFVAPKVPEQATPLEQGRETRESLSDGPKGDPAAAQPAFTPPPLPVIDPAQQQPSAGQPIVTDDNPTNAADEDLIEKEWVEKAKKVVAETRNDPYAQDRAISKLQADYLNKRYGRQIILPKEE